MPANPTITSISTALSTVTLSWSAVSGADGYRCYRRRFSGGTYWQEVADTVNLTFTETVASYDLDTVGTVSIERWEYKLTAYDASGESSGTTDDTTTTALVASDIASIGLDPTPYNDGSDQLASYTFTNSSTVTATAGDTEKLIFESRFRIIGEYAGDEAN